MILRMNFFIITFQNSKKGRFVYFMHRQRTKLTIIRNFRVSYKINVIHEIKPSIH